MSKTKIKIVFKNKKLYINKKEVSDCYNITNINIEDIELIINGDICGNITTKSDLKINGDVIGNIKTDGNITISGDVIK